MTRYYGDHEFESRHGRLRVEFDISVNDGKRDAIRRMDYVPGRQDLQTTRIELTTPQGTPYAVIYQRGQPQAIKNGTDGFYNIDEERGLQLYGSASPHLRMAINEFFATASRSEDALARNSGLVAVLRETLSDHAVRDRAHQALLKSIGGKVAA